MRQFLYTTQVKYNSTIYFSSNVTTYDLFITFLWLLIYKLLSCSPNILIDSLRRYKNTKFGVIAIKKRKRYLRADLSNVGQCNKLKVNEKKKTSKWINTQTTIKS